MSLKELRERVLEGIVTAVTEWIRDCYAKAPKIDSQR